MQRGGFKLEFGMDLYSLMLLSIGLAMDAFSVALVTGFGLGNVKLSQASRISFTFGVAHIIMPTLGWFLGATVVDMVSKFDHWIAFALLLIVGGKMIKAGLGPGQEIDPEEILRTTSLLMFTVAVSIDALAVGLSFSVQGLSIFVPSLFMGVGTLVFTFVGLMIGNRTGRAFGKKAQIFGGLVLILIGARIVFTHVFG